jgi:regulator of sigma E protease
VSELPFYLAAFLVALSILIFIHELGHYTVARLCGVKVLRFSIGFGRMLWQKRLGRDQTEWAISLFPLGGYVKMLDEREGDVLPEEQHRAFNRQSVGKRSLIVVAGPLANFLLAIALYWAVFMVGSQELLPILGKPPVGTPAAIAALSNGDQVRSVDGQPVTTWNDLRWLLLQKAADQDSVELEVINENNEISNRHLLLSVVRDEGWEGDGLERLGIGFYRPEIPPVFGNVVADGPAARAGLKSGDKVLRMDGRPIVFWHELVIHIRDSAERTIHLDIERQGQIVAVDVIPEGISERGRVVGKIGVAVAESKEVQREMRAFISYGFFAAGGKAITETWDKSIFSLVMMGKMLTGEVSWKNLSGPVTIADYAGKSAKLGLDYYVKFVALVSISLGVLNLLPVPMLDGGHLMYHIIEVIRGKALSDKSMEIAQQIGVFLLFVLMAFAFFNDLNRLFFG